MGFDKADVEPYGGWQGAWWLWWLWRDCSLYVGKFHVTILYKTYDTPEG